MDYHQVRGGSTDPSVSFLLECHRLIVQCGSVELEPNTDEESFIERYNLSELDSEESNDNTATDSLSIDESPRSGEDYEDHQAFLYISNEKYDESSDIDSELDSDPDSRRSIYTEIRALEVLKSFKKRQHADTQNSFHQTVLR